MIFRIAALVFVLFLTLIVSNNIPSFAEETGSILLSVNYQNGDVASASGMSIVVYQDKIKEPIINKTEISSLPHTISSLSLNHTYKVEIFQNSMYSGYGIVNLKNVQEGLNIKIKPNIGMRFFVYYDDGKIPISGIVVNVKSHDDALVRKIKTDLQGQTPTVWAPTSAKEGDYYYAEIEMNKQQIYKSESINALYSGKQDIIVKTDWPEEITNLISIKVYEYPNIPINRSDGKFGIEIRDSNNNKIKELSINKIGEAQFSNLKVGEYFVFVVQFPANKLAEPDEIFSKKILFSGLEDSVDIIINESSESEQKPEIFISEQKSEIPIKPKIEKSSWELPDWFSEILFWQKQGIVSEREIKDAINFLRQPQQSTPNGPKLQAPSNILTVTENKKEIYRNVVDLGTPKILDSLISQDKIIISNDAPKSGENGIPFKVGTTKVTWTAKDSDGNVGIAYQNVTVIENPLETPTNQNNKRVMIDFDDGYASVFNFGKPIMDKYNIKTTQYIICGVPIDKQTGYMSWQNIHEMAAAGHDIQSHSMNHLDANTLSESKLETEYGKYVIDCFTRNNIFNIKAVALPFGKGWDNKIVTKTLMNTYDFGRGPTVHSITSLHCESELSPQTNCETFSSEGTGKMNTFHRYNIPWWSHDLLVREGYNDAEIFSKFIKFVNQATKNTEKETLEIPIVVYHRLVLDNSDSDLDSLGTSVTLFEAEMKYLHDNGFKIFTAKDYGYDEKNNWITLDPSSSDLDPLINSKIDSNSKDNALEDPMHNVFSSFGLSTHSGRQIQAEYVSETSSLVGKKIDSITVNLKRVGLPADMLKVGIFNEDKSVKYLFGEINTSDISKSYTDYTVSLPKTQTYKIDVGDRIGIKLASGDLENLVAIMTDQTNFFDDENSYLTYYTDSWIELKDKDLHMILKSSKYESDLSVSSSILDQNNSSEKLVSLNSNKPATIFYTTNGETPTTSSQKYISPFSISSTTTVKYFAKDKLDNTSTTVIQVVTINSEKDEESQIYSTTIHDISEINPTKLNGREWFSNWGNGNSRTLTSGDNDPDDLLFFLRGSNDSTIEIDGNGTATLSGNQPRMYVKDPFGEEKWKNTEITIYSKRIEESSSNTSAGLVIGARSNHNSEDDCNVDTYYSRMLYDGNANFEKELEHPNVSQPKPPNNKIDWEKEEIPYNKWIGHKFVIRDYDSGSKVKLQMYLDKTDGLNGGDWDLVAEWDDDGTWNVPPSSCGFSENKVITEANSSVFIRNTEISSSLYKKFSIREINPLS